MRSTESQFLSTRILTPISDAVLLLRSEMLLLEQLDDSHRGALNHHPIGRQIALVAVLGDEVFDELLALLGRGVFTVEPDFGGFGEAEGAILLGREIGESAAEIDFDFSYGAEHDDPRVAIELVGTYDLVEVCAFAEDGLSFGIEDFVREPIRGKPVMPDAEQALVQLVRIVDFKPLALYQGLDPFIDGCPSLLVFRVHPPDTKRAGVALQRGFPALVRVFYDARRVVVKWRCVG